MQIDSNIRIDLLKGVRLTLHPTLRLPEPESRTDFKPTEPLTLALQNQDDLRAAQVEQAMTLIGQPQWPPAETIRRIATLLADKLCALSDEAAWNG
jgi:hypothetical protein